MHHLHDDLLRQLEDFEFIFVVRRTRCTLARCSEVFQCRGVVELRHDAVVQRAERADTVRISNICRRQVVG